MAGGTNSIGMDNWRVTAAETEPQIEEPMLRRCTRSKDHELGSRIDCVP
jgi:hypothetical protein